VEGKNEEKIRDGRKQEAKRRGIGDGERERERRKLIYR